MPSNRSSRRESVSSSSSKAGAGGAAAAAAVATGSREYEETKLPSGTPLIRPKHDAGDDDAGDAGLAAGDFSSGGGIGAREIGTGYSRFKHIVHDGALQMPSDAYGIMATVEKSAWDKTGITALSKYELPGLDSVVRPCLDPTVKKLKLTVLEIEKVQVSKPAPPAPPPTNPLAALYQQSQSHSHLPREIMVTVSKTSAKSKIIERRPINKAGGQIVVEPERIRGGGGGDGDDHDDEAVKQKEDVGGEDVPSASLTDDAEPQAGEDGTVKTETKEVEPVEASPAATEDWTSPGTEQAVATEEDAAANEPPAETVPGLAAQPPPAPPAKDESKTDVCDGEDDLTPMDVDDYTPTTTTFTANDGDNDSEKDKEAGSSADAGDVLPTAKVAVLPAPEAADVGNERTAAAAAATDTSSADPIKTTPSEGASGAVTTDDTKQGDDGPVKTEGEQSQDSNDDNMDVDQKEPSSETKTLDKEEEVQPVSNTAAETATHSQSTQELAATPAPAAAAPDSSISTTPTSQPTPFSTGEVGVASDTVKATRQVSASAIAGLSDTPTQAQTPAPAGVEGAPEPTTLMSSSNSQARDQLPPSGHQQAGTQSLFSYAQPSGSAALQGAASSTEIAQPSGSGSGSGSGSRPDPSQPMVGNVAAPGVPGVAAGQLASASPTTVLVPGPRAVAHTPHAQAISGSVQGPEMPYTPAPISFSGVSQTVVPTPGAYNASSGVSQPLGPTPQRQPVQSAQYGSVPMNHSQTSGFRPHPGTATTPQGGIPVDNAAATPIQQTMASHTPHARPGSAPMATTPVASTTTLAISGDVVASSAMNTPTQGRMSDMKSAPGSQPPNTGSSFKPISLTPTTAGAATNAAVTVAVKDEPKADPKKQETPPAQVLPTKLGPQWEEMKPENNDDSLTPPAELPPRPEWYNKDGIADLERSALPEWFNTSAPHRTPETYIETREKIIKLSDTVANRNVTHAMIRRAVIGDAGSLHRLRTFLVNWGIINQDAMNESMPTPADLRAVDGKSSSSKSSKKRFDEGLQGDLIYAVVQQSKRRKLEHDGVAGSSSNFIPIDWEEVAETVGHGASPEDCQRNFMMAPLKEAAETARKSGKAASERSITPDASTEPGGSKQAEGTLVSSTTQSKIDIQQEFIQGLVDGADPAVLQKVLGAAIEATGGNLAAAQSATILGLQLPEFIAKARNYEIDVATKLSRLVDLRMQKLENRMSMLDDVEGILEAEKVALELERRDLYTARCRHWFGGT